MTQLLINKNKQERGRRNNKRKIFKTQKIESIDKTLTKPENILFKSIDIECLDLKCNTYAIKLYIGILFKEQYKTPMISLYCTYIIFEVL